MTRFFIACAAAALTAPVFAQPPTPPVADMARAMREAQPYLFKAGQADVFEISTSQMAVLRANNPEVRAFATMLVDHHSRTTNLALAAAMAAGVPAPPPVLDARQRDMITQLMNAAADDFDRVYLTQQVPAHEDALALHSAYARGGDTAQLRTTAQSAVPIVTSHLERARTMLGGR